MPAQTIANSLNKAYRGNTVERSLFDSFKQQLYTFYDQIAVIDSEEKVKGDLMDFLKRTFYGQEYKVSPNGKIDCAIHLGDTIESPIGTIIEVKMPTNRTEMINSQNLNRKALQELLLYYLRERVEKHNYQLKNLIVTDVYEYYVFDAHEFERLFHSDRKLIRDFNDFVAGRLASSSTDFFYKEIAAPAIEAIADSINYTYFNILEYKRHLEQDNDRRLLDLFKVFSPEHLLKRQFQTDSNKLNTGFYAELLYILGLEETEDKDSRKKIITRRKEKSAGSIIENAISVIDDEDVLDEVRNIGSLGADREEKLFNVALSLTITWINRILFMKLLEAQMLKYHKGYSSYAFMNSRMIPDFDEMNALFFQVLARRPQDRKASVNDKYDNVPYLNSSLFELSELERKTIRISNLRNLEMPIYASTVLNKWSNHHRHEKVSTLKYLLDFLDAYDFSGEGSDGIQENAKTLINASVLGLIFEKINGHKDGSVFTPGAVTMYMSREAVRSVLVKKFNEEYGWNCNGWNALLDKEIDDVADANRIVDSIRICDPAVGSGHFLVSVLNEIICSKYELGILVDCNGRRIKRQDWCISISNDELLVNDSDGDLFAYVPGQPESQRIQETLFYEKRKVIENCMFGVDLNPNAVNICRLRLWIELLKNAYYTRESGYSELETLPNIDINIKVGNSLLHRFDMKQDISDILRTSGVSIAEYQNAVADYKNARSKEDKSKLNEIISRIKSTLRTQISLRDPKIMKLLSMQKELSDLQAPKLFEEERKQKLADAKRLKELSVKINRVQKEIDEIKENHIFVGAFEWRIEFPELLDAVGNFVGFDCIIGNPPYIQLQKMGTEADALAKMNYCTFERTGDIYCLFYEMGMSLLKPDGLLSFITSNKWMRAGYGESLRQILSTKYNPSLLVDFAGYKVFDSATVDVNILNVFNSSPIGHTNACLVNKEDFDLKNLSDYVQTHIQDSCFSDSPWTILSEIDLSIKRKIEERGIPLKEWDVNIYRGILTGYNDAFIISTAQRDEILNNCQTEEERSKTAELIRPILRGRDIKRYSYNWAGLYIINTHNGYNDVERIHIDEYPALKRHLDNHWNMIAKRADKGATPYNLRNCAYVDEFSKPKIVWKRVGSIICFSYDANGLLGLDSTCFATGEFIQYICCVLNSPLGHYMLNSAPRTGTGDLLISVQAVEPLLLPAITINQNNDFTELIGQAITGEPVENEINSIIYDLYGLTEEEISYITENFS